MQGMRGNMVLRATRNPGTSAKPALVRPAPMPIPHHNTESERVMISGLLKEWRDLGKKLKPETLYHWHHRLVVKRLAECADPGPYTLYAALRRTGEYREWNNLPAWIAEVWELDPTGCSFEYNAKIVTDCWRLRSLAHAANEIIRDAMHPWGSAAEVVQESLRKLTVI